MHSKFPFPTTSFLDIPIHQVKMQEVLDWVEKSIQEKIPRFLCTMNAALLVWSRKSPFLKEAYQQADLITADSFVLYYVLKLLGTPVPEPLEACQIMFQFLEKTQQKGYRLYFLGAKPDILEKAIFEVKKKYPAIQIVGYHHGYFGAEEEDSIAQAIRHAKPDCLFVGMSSPLKEYFLKKYLKIMNVPISLGVGGGFDILAGQYRHAPHWMHRLGLAWFYRFLMEPRRMWKRYLTTNTIFLWLFFKIWIRKALHLPHIRRSRA